jgi:hypothetical protein
MLVFYNILYFFYLCFGSLFFLKNFVFKFVFFFQDKSLMKFFLFLLFYNKIYIDKEWTRGEQKTQKTD